MIFFWTSSQFLIHIRECRLSYCINKNSFNSLQLFIVFFEYWALTNDQQKVSSIMHPHHVVRVTELFEESLIQSLLLTHHCYSPPCVYFLTFTTVITSQYGLKANNQWCSRDRDQNRDQAQISRPRPRLCHKVETETETWKFETKTGESRPHISLMVFDANSLNNATTRYLAHCQISRK